MRSRSLSIGIAFFVLVLFTSCGGGSQPGDGSAPPPAKEIRREFRNGPFAVRLLADKDSPGIAESVVLTIEADAPEGYDAVLPGFGEKLGEFGIRDYRDEPPRLTPDRRIVSRKVYTLDPFLSGDYIIAPMKVTFHRKADSNTVAEGATGDAESGEHQVTTEEITIRVHSLLEKDQKEMALNPIRGPLTLPAGPFPARYVLLWVGAAAAIAVGTWFFLRKRRQAGDDLAVTVLPAHELAFRQLREILDSGLVERGEIKIFFSKVSDVLRCYIENRFGIHAPKRTTEEFFLDISRNAPFSDDMKGLLVEFMLNCDLVKFAEHTPLEHEIQGAFESCKAFIEATRDDLQRPGPGSPEKEA